MQRRLGLTCLCTAAQSMLVKVYAVQCHQWCSATCSRSWYAYALAATAVHNQHGQLLSQQNEIDCALTPAVQLAPREKRRGLQRVHTQSRRNQRIAQPTYHQSLSDCTVHVVHNLNSWCICTDTHVCCCLAGDAARMPPLLHTVRPQRCMLCQKLANASVSCQWVGGQQRQATQKPAKALAALCSEGPGQNWCLHYLCNAQAEFP